MGRIFKPFLEKLGWVDYRTRYEINLELLLQRIYECNSLKQQKDEIERQKNAAVRAVQVFTEEQRIYQNKIETYESIIHETSILLEQLKNQSVVFSGCVEELENRYPQLFGNATTPKTTN